MRARPFVLRLSLCVSAALGAAAVIGACLDQDEENVLADVPFDGGSLGACMDGSTKLIPAAECPGACSGKFATAICVGAAYAECSCIPSLTTCDSGCCRGVDYVPVDCKGKVVTLDPSEGLCDAASGYLVCNGTCFASFSCEIPAGFTLAPVDAGRDAARAADAGHPKEGGAPGDARGDGPPEGSTDAPADVGSLDAPPADAPAADAPKG